MPENINIKWSEELVSDCRKIIKLVKVVTGQTFLRAKWELGDRISKDYVKFGRAEFGHYTQENLARDLEISIGHVSALIKFRELVGNDFDGWIAKNLDIAGVPQWRKIVREWLVQKPREKKEKPTAEEILLKCLVRMSKDQVKVLVTRAESGFKIYKSLAGIIPLKELDINIAKLENLVALLSGIYENKGDKKNGKTKSTEA